MKQIIQMEHNMVLRIPNGRRQASWLFYKLGPEDLNSGLTRTNPAYQEQIGPSGIKVQRSNRSATLPPCSLFYS